MDLEKRMISIARNIEKTTEGTSFEVYIRNEYYDTILNSIDTEIMRY